MKKMNVNKHVKILITSLGVSLSLALPQTTQGMDGNPKKQRIENVVDMTSPQVIHVLQTLQTVQEVDHHGNPKRRKIEDTEDTADTTPLQVNQGQVIQVLQPLQPVQAMDQQGSTVFPWSFIQNRIIQPAVVASWERNEQYDCLLNLRTSCKRMNQTIDFIQLVWLAKKYGIVSREGIDRLRLFLTAKLHFKPDSTTRGTFFKLSNLVNPVEDTIPLSLNGEMGPPLCFMMGLRKGPLDAVNRKLEIKITLWDLFNRNEDESAKYLEFLKGYWDQHYNRMPFLITWTGSWFIDSHLLYYLLAEPQDISRRTLKDNFCKPLPYRRYPPKILCFWDSRANFQ